MKKKKIQSAANSVWQPIHIFLGIFLTIFIILIFINGGLIRNFGFIFIGIIIFLFSFLFFLLFFSQFVLPVTNLKQRLKVAHRLLLYLLGQHGPAVYIEDGNAKERKGERLKKGPGVILLNAASAALVRNPTEFLGAMGPGLAFTQPEDSIGGVVDLRIQNVTKGPRIEEDPFIPQKEDETADKFAERMERKNSTLALTRDGIEICAKVSMVFKIDAREGLGNTKFGYEPQAVERAIVGLPVDHDSVTKKPENLEDWKWLPPLLAVNIWREFISKITLNELFPLAKKDSSKIEILLKQMRQKMVEENYQVLDDYGRTTNETQRSEEYHLLKERGIKVIAANITHIFLPQSINEQLINRWKSNWLGFAQMDKNTINDHHTIQMQYGKDQATMDFAYGVTHYLGSIPLDNNLSQSQLLESLLKGNQYLIKHIPGLLAELQKEQTSLQDILEWIDSPEETI